MSPKLKELLERCGPLQGTIGYDGLADSDYAKRDLIAIAVNHFERLLALTEDAACSSCEKWAAKPCRCDSCVARGILASIEAAVENGTI